MKPNLNHSILPSAEEIQLYQEGKLDAARVHEIEMLAEENPLLSDALEGYSTLPVFGSVAGISQGIQQKVISGSSYTTGTSIVSSISHVGAWIAGGAAVIAVATTLVLMNTEPASLEKLTQERIENTAGNNASIVLNDGQPQEEITQADNQNTELTDAHGNSNVIVAKAADENAMVAQNQSTSTLSASSEDEQSIVMDPSILVQNDNQVEIALPRHDELVAIGVISIDKHRVVDYTPWRKSKWPNRIERSTRTTEDANSATEMSSSISYEAYLKNCLSAFDQQRYKESIQGFQYLLNEYPVDVNAQYYGAMSYYEHDQPVLALELLEKVVQNPIIAFRDEALYYQAKCLKMLNRTEESDKIFNQLIEKGGHWATKAHDAMD